jgi:hypothetical protein
MSPVAVIPALLIGASWGSVGGSMKLAKALGVPVTKLGFVPAPPSSLVWGDRFAEPE